MSKFLKISILPLLLLTLVFSQVAWATPRIPEPSLQNIYVQDFAGLLDASAEEELQALGASLEQQAGVQAVVVTVNDMGGYPIEEYSLQLFRKWGIGDKQKNNGILLLVSKEELLAGKPGKVRIEVGYGLEGVIPDGKAGRILDEYVLPSLQSRNYNEGLRQGYLAIVSAVAADKNISLGNPEMARQLKGSGSIVSVVFFMFFMILFLFVASLAHRKRRRRYNDDNYKKPPFFGGFGGFGGGGFGGGGFGGGGFGGGSSGGGGASR